MSLHRACCCDVDDGPAACALPDVPKTLNVTISGFKTCSGCHLAAWQCVSGVTYDETVGRVIYSGIQLNGTYSFTRTAWDPISKIATFESDDFCFRVSALSPHRRQFPGSPPTYYCEACEHCPPPTIDCDYVPSTWDRKLTLQVHCRARTVGGPEFWEATPFETVAADPVHPETPCAGILWPYFPGSGEGVAAGTQDNWDVGFIREDEEATSLFTLGSTLCSVGAANMPCESGVTQRNWRYFSAPFGEGKMTFSITSFDVP